MLKTTLPAKQAVSYIVDNYRQLQGSGNHPATLRYFAAALTEVLRASGLQVSHQSIKNWGDRRYLPDLYVMLQIADQAQHDWRRDFALDILAAVEPDRYKPVSEIGRAALQAQR